MIKIVIGLSATLLLLGGLYGKALGDMGEQRQVMEQLEQDLKDQREQVQKALEERERMEELLAENREARETIVRDAQRLRAQLREDRRHASQEYQDCAGLDVPEPSFERLRALAIETHEDGH